MKIKALSRPQSTYRSDTFVPKTSRNLNPELHPFARAREYQKALNATKLERAFAQPFVAQIGKGHVDGVYATSIDPTSLEKFASGSGDGVVKVWDLPSREEKWSTRAHEGIVKDLSWKEGKLLTCSNDKTVKLYDPYNSSSSSALISTYLAGGGVTSVTSHRSQPNAAAASSVLSIFDLSRGLSTPIETITPPSHATINKVRWNQVETSLLASCDNNRNIICYDLRTSTAVAKSVLSLSANSIAFSPMEAMNFVCGSEDHNIYLFDMRNLSRALNIYKDHVHAVMDVEWSPTGEELVSASYDRSIRIWERSRGHSRDIYHTKRMQRVFCATFTPDSKYILSGSDDGNIRLWRANASERSNIQTSRQRQSREYDRALVERYSHMPEIKRIKRHRHVPKTVKKAGEIKREELKAIKRKEENRRKHSKEGQKKRRAEREKMVLAVEE